MHIKEISSHLRDRPYMSGVDREYLRVKATGEVFTPTWLVQSILDGFDASEFNDQTKTFIDPACGDGQFLSEVLIRKLETVTDDNGNVSEQDFETALRTIYGVDIMQDNVDLCRERLLCGREELRDIVEQNIYQANSLTFSYKFKPMSETRRKREERTRRREAKERAERLKQEFNVQQNKKLFGKSIV